MSFKTVIRLISLMALLCFFITLGGCLTPEEEAEPVKKKVPVTVMKVENQSLPVMVEAIGRLNADREVTLSLELSGQIAKINADMGDRVKAGQVLVQLDPKDYMLSLNEAKAARSSAEASYYAARSAYHRAQKLLPNRLITPEGFERVEAEYLSAQAGLNRAETTVDLAQRRLEKTSIIAPFDGHVAERLVEVGQTVGLGQYSGQTIILLVDLDQMRALVHVAENDYVHLDKDDRVSVVVDALPGRVFPGRIDKIGVKADPRTNTFPVEILVDNPDYILKAGMTGHVRITAYTLENTIMIPQSAVLYRENGEEIFVVAEQRARKRPIKLGRTNDSSIQVLDGLAPGDFLVTAGGQYLEDGDLVEIATGKE